MSVVTGAAARKTSTSSGEPALDAVKEYWDQHVHDWKIATICSSVNRLFFMGSSLVGGSHSLKLQLVLESVAGLVLGLAHLAECIAQVAQDVKLVQKGSPSRESIGRGEFTPRACGVQ